MIRLNPCLLPGASVLELKLLFGELDANLLPSANLRLGVTVLHRATRGRWRVNFSEDLGLALQRLCNLSRGCCTLRMATRKAQALLQALHVCTPVCAG